MNSTTVDPRPRRALRVAVGTALSLAVSFSLALPLPFLAPMLTLFLLVMRNQPLPLKGGIALAVVVALTTSSGLLVTPLLQYYPLSGVLVIALSLFGCFHYALRGGNNLLSTFVVIGLTMIAAAGATSFALALMVIEGLIKSVLVTTIMVMISHWLFPEPKGLPAPTPPAKSTPDEAKWIALRAALVVMPSFLMALIDPASYMPLIMKSVNLGQQVCITSSRNAGREIIGSTLLGGLLAIGFWTLLSILPHIWMFFILTLFFILLLARRLYRLVQNTLSPSFWLNTASTMIILLGQSVQDSATGKDVYTAFAVRMGLFTAVTLYACAAIYVIDSRRMHRLKNQLSG
ncbi:MULTISPECIES: DUF2955 domain-containing protein [Pseudomonas]|jgi:hypothetical protein|uniref:DUF2955 domain-containing protein n=1 Tax=Pseudomonas TaxID=286 RepID=UPI0015623961|nr:MULTISPECIES: DUF2955 domain-containing protein [unclassified Pseudomonas]NRH29329.1 DUF2955 domain-containing protein [Pseudomonas sp. MS19]